MNYEYVKAKPIHLRETGRDERWLQDLVCKDPSILGLGDLVLIERERNQPTGGRIDLILSDPEENTRYEVEIMLGTVDESHIIRSIEYWDVERRRYPSYEHRAVIIAEEITNRFFNVINLLNRAVPMIAIQLNALLVDAKLSINFVKVLDIMEEADEVEDEPADRKYWESRASLQSLEIMDKVISLISDKPEDVRIKYNRGRVSVGTSGRYFSFFYPRKGSHIPIHIRPGADVRDEFIDSFKDKGVDCNALRANSLKLVLTMKEFTDNKDMIKKLLNISEERSRK